MDIHSPREIGRQVVIEPIIIGKPVAFFGNHDKVSSPLMIQLLSVAGFTRKKRLHSRLLFQKLPNSAHQRVVFAIDMRHLVICNGKNPARPIIEKLAS